MTKAEQNRDSTRKGRLTVSGTESIIRAPAAGTILTRTVNPGDPIVPLTSYQPGTEMATVADMRDLIFKGTVDEIDVGKLSVGMTTRIKVGALPTDVVTGRVSRIAPQAQQKEGATLFDVEVELESIDGCGSGETSLRRDDVSRDLDKPSIGFFSSFSFPFLRCSSCPPSPVRSPSSPMTPLTLTMRSSQS